MKLATALTFACTLAAAGARAEAPSRYSHLRCVVTSDSTEGGGFDVSYCLNARNTCWFEVAVTGRDVSNGVRRSTGLIAPGKDGRVCFAHRFNVLEFDAY
jgi:hypothetical protein